MLKMLSLVSLLMMIAPFAFAGDCSSECSEPNLKVWGENRIRLNLENMSFVADADAIWATEARTRIGIAGSKGDNAGVVFELQDSRMLGDDPGTLAFNNGTFEAGVHQAYFWYKPCEKGWLKGGRMSVGLHNERLIGKVDWSNVGRTYEGFMFDRQLNDNISFAGAAFQVLETYTAGDNAGDPMVYVLNMNMKEQGVDFFLIQVKDNGNALGLGTDFNYSLNTFGAYSNRSFGQGFFYDAMFAMQSGNDDADAKHSGMLAYAKVGKKMDNGMKVGVVVDYTTGDDPDTADEYEAFNNLFYTGHKFRGAMDYFVAQPMDGLMDIGLFAYYPVNDSWTVGGTFHKFDSVQDMNAAGDKAFGTEIDLAAKYSNGNFRWETGFSMFSDEDYGATAGMGSGEGASWIYSMTTVDF